MDNSNKADKIVDETSDQATITMGRPQKHDETELIKTITDIAIAGSAADPRRRSEVINTCKTLDDLYGELQKLGYELSRTSVYLRLRPKKS